MSAAASPRHGPDLRRRAGLCSVGPGPVVVPRPAAGESWRQAPGQAPGTETDDLGRRSASGDLGRPGGVSVAGRGAPQCLGRLRVHDGLRVSRKRVLRIMRENNLVSPHRCRRRDARAHDDEIVTDAANVMWGTDGIRVFTVDDRWGWIVTAALHWNAECVGWHLCKKGDRFATAQPISMGLARLYGSTAAGTKRGLSLRMDHGTQSLSESFAKQIADWGIQPSYAFVEHPQTNGVAERFNRTLKEQVIHGRIYRNIDELRDAVREFVETYDAEWLVEKNGASQAPLRPARPGMRPSHSRPPHDILLPREPGAIRT